MNGTKVIQKWVFVAAIVFASVVGWMAIQSEARTPAKQPAKQPVKQPAKQPVKQPTKQPVVKGPTKRVRPPRPAQRISSKIRGKLRALEHALKQVAEKTRDRSDGTLSKRNALVRAYAQAIAATKGMARAKYTPRGTTIRTWMVTTHAAGSRLSSLSRRYSNCSQYRHHGSRSGYSSKRRTSGVSDEAWHKKFCKELSRQQVFVRGLKPAQAGGKRKTMSLPRLP